MAKEKKAAVGIVIPELQIKTMTVTIIGDSSLIVHKWSEKAKKQMLDTMMKVPKGPRAAKNPEQEYKDSLYTFPDGTYGFPAVGIKKAAVDAASFVDGVSKVEVRGCFHIGEAGDKSELVKIIGKPTMREDTVRVGIDGTDLHYRGEFKSWKATFDVRFSADILTPAQLLNLFQRAGFSIGIGEWRAQKNGGHGLFHVAKEGE